MNKRPFLTSPVVVGLILASVFATGFSALVYEVVWQRYLANFLGSEAKATAFVLAVFLGGLACGYALFGRLSRRWSAAILVKASGWAEFAIGAWALIFPNFYEWIWIHFGSLDPSHPLAGPTDFLLAVVLIGVPTVLMGGTLPLLTQALSRDKDSASAVHARVYSINTAGAFFGCILSGFYLLPRFGHDLTLMLVGPVNLLAGLGLIQLGALSLKRDGNKTVRAQNEERAVASRRLPSSPYLLAALAGFCSITLQTLLVRIVGLCAGASEYAFSMVVSLFILLLALGASRMTRDSRFGWPLWVNQLIAVAGVLFLYWQTPDLSYWAHVIRTLFSVTGPSFYAYYLALMIFLGLSLLPGVGSMGRTMPLLFHLTKRTYGDLGAHVGRLYWWNTLGCVFGTLFGGYWLLNWFNVDSLILCVVVLLAVTASLAAQIERPKFFVLRGAWALPALACLCLFLPRWPDQRLALGLFREIRALPFSYEGPAEFYRHWYKGITVVDRRDDPNSSVAVIEVERSAQETSRSLVVNGKPDGNTYGDLDTMLMLADIPVFFSPVPASEVAVVGYGLGVSAGSFTQFPEISRVDVMEISAGVRRFSHDFGAANHDAESNPKVTWNVGDAYRFLTTRDRKYSIIASEPSNPWVVGVERLYSREFYQRAQSRLQPGGIYSQWLGIYNLAPTTVGMIIRTFSSVFKDTRIFNVAGGDVILLGSENFSMKGLSRRFSELNSSPAVRDELRRISVEGPEEFLGHEKLIPAEMYADLPLHTLSEPKLAYAGGKDSYLGAATDIDAIEKNPKAAPWFHRGLNRALAFDYLLSNPDVDWKVVQARICRQGKAGFFETWNTSNPICTRMLVAMAARGMIPPAFRFRELDRRLLREMAGLDRATAPRRLAEVNSAERSEAIDQVEWAIQLFERSDSPILKLDPARLISIAVPCTDASAPTVKSLVCLKHLSEALYMRGHLSEGEKEAEKFRQVVGEGSADPLKQSLQELDKLSHVARSAWGSGP